MPHHRPMNLITDPVWLRLLPAPLRAKLAGRANLLAVINNSSWLLFDKLIRMTLGLLVGAWVARYLGPTQFGELAFVLSYLAFFQAIALLGMDGIIVRDIARDKTNAGKILGTAFMLRLGTGIVCWLVAVGCMAWSNGWQDDSVWITALAGGSLVFQASDTIDLWFQSQSESRRTVVVKLIAYLLSNGIKVALILNNATLLAFAAVMMLDALAAAIGLAFAYRNFSCGHTWQHSASQAKKLFKESWLFLLSSISIMIYMRIDQIMIKEMLGEKELGIYAAVLPIATLWQFVPMALVTSLAPYVSRKKHESNHAYMDTIANIFRGFALLGWLTCIPIAILSKPIINMLFGQAFIGGSTVLSIYIFTNIFINMGVAQSLWTLNNGESKIAFYKTIFGAAICIAGNFLLIPKIGITGVAIAGVLAQFGSTTISNIIFAPKILKLQIRSMLLLSSKNIMENHE